MKTKYYLITGILGVAILLASLASVSFNQQKESEVKELTMVQNTNKQYVCSMHPQVIRNSPGDCPICGMFLIELISGDKNVFDTALTDIVRSVNQSVLGSVMTVIPEEAIMPLVLESTGIINYDPRKIRTISARFGGLIERSFVKYQFQHVRRGQKIYEIYSPDIYAKQWNYIKLIQAYPDREDLTTEAMEWLKLLGLSKGQIDSLKHSNVKPDYHLAVYSPAEGYTVSSDFDPENFFFTGAKAEDNPEISLAGAGRIGLKDGMTVETGAPLFKLIDVRSLRVDLKVKTEVSALLRRGQEVIITDEAIPGRQFNSVIDQIEPLNGGLFQTVRVYLTDNERLLLPGRQIEARIMAGSHNGLWVPASSVVARGQGSSVFVMNNDRFVATNVRTGVRSGDKIQILAGIDRNDILAGKALLLVDSDGIIDSD